MTALLLSLLAAVPLVKADAVYAERDYRQRLAALDGDVAYVTYATEPEETRDALKSALALVVSSTTRQPTVERSVPEQVTPTLYRLDLGVLGWSLDDWLRLTAEYPYDEHLAVHAKGGQLLVRADWLLLQLSDTNESDAYYRFLLGKVPKTRDEFLAEFGVDRKADKVLTWGQVEGNSGVAVNATRWLQSFPILRGYAWGTRDVLEVQADNDPLERLDGDFKHDGEEWIISIYKIHRATGDRGALQAYFLSDGEGNIVSKAPVDLVEDSTRFRGLAEIRNPGSCYQCHDRGLNETSTNELRAYIQSGAELFARTDEKAAEIEAFHLGSLKGDIEYANTLFGTIVPHVTGLSPEESAAVFAESIERFETDLDLDAAARELGVAPATLKNAIAVKLVDRETVGARVASLPHGGTIPRAAFEDRYRVLRRYVHDWLEGKAKP